jgi:hypothetical protein
MILGMCSQSVFASELGDCEKKIKEMLGEVKNSKVLIVEKYENGAAVINPRVDSYHMSADSSCGVEVANGTILTISKFKEALTLVNNVPAMERKKFETIMLNGNDPTFTQERVKAIVSCKMDENSVEYVTKVPVLTDGVKSPWAIEKLNISKVNGELNISLRASVTPISKIFRSITDCKLL